MKRYYYSEEVIGGERILVGKRRMIIDEEKVNKNIFLCEQVLMAIEGERNMLQSEVDDD